MKREFIVERQGRLLVLYAGLLNLAHESGLTAIRTELIQAPTSANEHVAICLATVVIEHEGIVRTFTGIGDASVENVSAAMRSSLIRMAETRAKARALRDAVNVGVSAFEELNDPDEGELGRKSSLVNGVARAARPERRAAVSTTNYGLNGATGASKTAAANTPATEAQLNAIKRMCASRGDSPEVVVRERYQTEDIESLTQSQAGELIRSLTVSSRVKEVGLTK